jgi:MscS family membrane protein
MSLLRKNRQGVGPSLNHTYTLSIAVAAALLLAVSGTSSPAQLPKLPPHPAETIPTPRLDPLGRDTPRSTVMGFLRYEDTGDYATAAHYFQLPPGQHPDLVQLARELRVISPNFKGNINLLSDDPNGTVESGLPPGQVRAGVVAVGGTTTDVILVRVDDPISGKIWLISQGTIANIPKLFAEVEHEPQTTADQIRIAMLSGRQFLGMTSVQWLGWLLSIPISWLLVWMLTFLLSAPRRVWSRLRKLPFHSVWDSPVGMPLRCMIAIILHGIFVYMLHPPTLYWVYYVRLISALLAGCFGWLVSRISDRGFDLALSRTRTHRGGGESILVLMHRLSRIGILIIALVAALALLGVNVSATLAGLGIGGLAVALAAQKTLENLLGGISLLMDKAVQVGDFCKIGDRLGTVEDIGLRSLKLRTLDQNMLVVPNGALAQMQFENMKARPKLLISQNFSLRIETRIDQLRFVLDNVQTMLNEEPAIESGTSRVRVTSFAGAAFELELFAYGKTGDWTELTAIRQDVILKIATIVEAAGTAFAAPTRLTYQSKDEGIDVEKADDIARQVTELRAAGALRLPGEALTGTKY